MSAVLTRCVFKTIAYKKHLRLRHVVPVFVRWKLVVHRSVLISAPTGAIDEVMGRAHDSQHGPGAGIVPVEK